MNRPALPRHAVLQPRLPDPCSIKLIGLGGVGGIVARYAALFVASLAQPARLVLVDGDAFEASNSHRMIFGACGNKAQVTRDELATRVEHTALSLIAIEEYVTPENCARLIRSGDIVLMAVDNHATRKLVNDHCAGLEEVCLISGGNDGVEPDTGSGPRRGTFGNVQIYLRRGGADAGPALTRFHPEIQHPADHLPTVSCTEQVASVPQILFANLAVASAMLNAFWLHLCGALHYGELAFDIADGLMRPTTPLAPPDANGEHFPSAQTMPVPGQP